MSKTYRRQGIESKIAINGSECNPKIAGLYTEYDFANSYSWERIYRLPTNYEAYRKFRKFHLDAGTAEFRQGSMKAWMRRIEQKKHRSVHRKKITQFLKGINDDVVQEELPKFPSRWW